MSRLLFNHSGIAADSFGHLLALSRVLTGDVIEGFQVQAKTTPAMSVAIGQGTAGITTGTYPDSFRYWIANDTTAGAPAGESVTITTASSSNPRIDTIVAYVNEGATFSTSPVNFPTGWTAAAVAGTPASSPSAPSGATIQAAVGAGNPYIILANVLVGTSVTQINSGNITDMRTMATSIAGGTLGYAEITSTFSTTTSGSDVDVTGLSVTVNVPAGVRRVRITAYCTSLLKSGSSGDVVIWKIKEGSTQLNEANWNIPGSNFGIGGATCTWESTVPSAGSHTYKVSVNQSTAGTVTVSAAAGKLSFIAVEAV